MKHLRTDRSFYYLEQVQKWRWKVFKEEEFIKILKICLIGLIENV